jgi:branched-chain amino acid transport system ATP-binding protein
MSLAIDQLRKSFGGLRVVEDVTFEAAADVITGLIGPNGAGKSTLFAVISGYQEQDSGTIRFGGEEIGTLPPDARARRGIARTFQVPRPFGHLSVHANLMAAGPRQPGEHVLNLLCRPGVVRRRERELEGKADALLAFLGLKHFATAPAATLSGGQQKLLELGRALMTEPRYILLDEPFAGVNAVLIGQIAERIRTLAGSGTGFLIVEHNLPALARIASRLLVMDRGRLIAAGSPELVFANEAVRSAYIGGAA